MILRPTVFVLLFENKVPAITPPISRDPESISLPRNRVIIGSLLLASSTFRKMQFQIGNYLSVVFNGTSEFNGRRSRCRRARVVRNATEKMSAGWLESVCSLGNLHQFRPSFAADENEAAQYRLKPFRERYLVPHDAGHSVVRLLTGSCLSGDLRQILPQNLIYARLPS